VGGPLSFFWNLLFLRCSGRQPLVFNFSASRILSAFCKLFFIKQAANYSFKKLFGCRFRLVDEFSGYDAGASESLVFWPAAKPEKNLARKSLRLDFAGPVPRRLLEGCLREAAARFEEFEILLPLCLEARLHNFPANLRFESAADRLATGPGYYWPWGSSLQQQRQAIDLLSVSPVLAPDSAIWREILPAEATEYLYPGEQPEFALDLLDRLEKDRPLRQKLLQSGARKQQEKYSLPAQLKPL
ncbi:MAG: hypothetical protein ACLFN5_07080, partial [bacterium]